MSIGKYKIPWRNGNPITWSNVGGHLDVEWRENKPFIATLEFERFRRSRNSSRAIFTERDSGVTFEMFFSDFERAIPFMECGSLVGKFCFQKRGTSIGVRHLASNPLEVLASAAEEAG